MKVKVEFVIDTIANYNKEEFREEIENLIINIDSDSELIEFNMYEIGDPKR